MGYKEMVLEAYNEPLTKVECSRKLNDPEHLSSSAVGTYTERLIKEDKLKILVSPEGKTKYIAKEQLLLEEIFKIDEKWGEFPRLKWEIIRLGLRFLQLMSDSTLNYTDFITKYKNLKKKFNPEMYQILKNMHLIGSQNNDEHFFI